MCSCLGTVLKPQHDVFPAPIGLTRRYSAPGVPVVRFSPSQAPILPPYQVQYPEVTDLCSALEFAAHPLLGFRLCSSSILRGPYEVKTPPCKLSAECVTLGSVLPHLKREDFPLPDIYILAITLVSSILQLSGTPWLQSSWNKQSLQFLRLRDDSNNSVDIKHPYLAQCKWDTSESIPVKQRQPVDGRNMLALAIMLLEINSGTPIESMRQSEDIGPGEQWSEGADLVTANWWLKRRVEMGRLTRRFADAITYCLQCYLDPFASFDNPEFSRAVIEKVLEPLEGEMQSLYGFM